MKNTHKVRGIVKFILFTGITFSLFYLILSFFENNFQVLTAHLSSIYLHAFNVENFVQGNEIYLRYNVAVISGLCSGIFEISLLSSFILATFEISLRKRIKWMLIGITTILLINPARITVSILLLNSEKIFIVSHDLLFRIMTFTTIIIIYAIFVEVEKKNNKKIKN